MKKIILPVILVAVGLWSCTTAYKTTTPDDVYYSPARTLKGGQDRYDEYMANSEDNYLRMKVQNRYRWGGLDDFTYWNDPRYDFGYSCMPSREVLLNPFNPYMGIGYSLYYSPWYNWYSPYTTIVYYRNPKVYYGNTNKSNLTAYRNGLNNNANNSRPTFGSLFKQAFSNTNNSSVYPYNNNSSTRTFSPGVTPSSSAGGRSGGFNSTGSSANTSRGPR